MKRDSVDKRSEQLFQAAREEVAPEKTRQRIAAALRAQRSVPTRPSTIWWPRFGLTFVLTAAGLLAAGFVALSFVNSQKRLAPVSIEAEAFTPAVRQKKASEPRAEEENVPENAPVLLEPPRTTTGSPAQRPLHQRNAARAPATLEQELKSMQRAQSALSRGDATTALAELDRFGREQGFRQLAAEASLLRIEALAAAGRTNEARTQARGFVQRHPNNPLVDRAQKFATPPAPAEPTRNENNATQGQ